MCRTTVDLLLDLETIASLFTETHLGELPHLSFLSIILDPPTRAALTLAVATAVLVPCS